jgi:hypothetical protein
MRRLLTLIAVISAFCCAGQTWASIEDDGESEKGFVLYNGARMDELRSRARRLGVSAASEDTTWIGYSGYQVSPANWWGVHGGFGNQGYYRPINGAYHDGVWDWESPAHGDSLQGWWPYVQVYTVTGGQTRTDRNRPWWALDYGNAANYVINQANGRTYGVVGVWHRDGGSLAAAPAALPTPEWTPAQGSFAAWMGVRAHGDATYTDPVTGNPFNEDVLMFTSFGALSPGGNDSGYPGYGSQMDQMLYRDIDLTGNTGQDVTVRFRFRTVMSTGAGTTAATRTGWFDSDPLGTTGGVANPQPNNFISSSDAGDAAAPRDSFMVYVGRAADEQAWLPAAANFGQTLAAQPVYDKQRRWFGEVLRWDRNPGSPPSNPQPLYYKELLSAAGVWPARADTSNPGWIDTTFVIPNAAVQPMLENSRVRLVFRVKTNRGFDDQGTAFSSNQRGAATVDRVSYRIGTNPEVVFGDFENASDIDNTANVSSVQAWKSTGKPPGIFHHTHLLADLIYEDLCGQKGDVSRLCNMSGVVVSMGDHDHAEAAGGLVEGTAQRERIDGVISPTIQLCGPYTGPGGTNVHGLRAVGSGPGDIDASDDYQIWYDVYTGIFDPFTKGNWWRYGCISYPGNSKDPDGSGPQLPYPAWGQLRGSSYPIYDPDPECLIHYTTLYSENLVKTSNANGIPDSMRIILIKEQQCFRFGVSTGCSPTDGAYWDNVSLAIVDAARPAVSVEPWMWLNDAFPATEAVGFPGTAGFDTAAAHVKIAYNTSQFTNSNLRFTVPGDSVVINGSSDTKRLDMMFRILPGPGNYEPIGRPDIGTIVKRPDSRAIVTKGDGSFWDAYRQTPGDFASANAVTLHHNALGGWDPNVWNSARCDTAEMNLFARQAAPGANVLGGPPWPYDWMATLHESDPHFATLGIVHNRCFVATAGSIPTDIVCNGTVPSYISSRPEHADVTGTTREGTKIVPDGLLTPGAHVEYFFRAQTATAPGTMSAMIPDTNLVLQPDIEESTDGHRWQQFGVLPNAWKKATYYHPVAREFGHGPACLLVVDGDDRHGNERVWVGVADTIGATPQRWWGAHNGWHAVGGGDVDDPAANRRGKDGQPGFVAEHLGQPGSGGTWDMYQVKAADNLLAPGGTLGCRLSNRTGGAGQQIVIDKSSRVGPTTEMLNAYYTMILYLSGDLSANILGPHSYKSANDVGLLINWLNAGSTAVQNRAFWAIGSGFAESNIFGSKAITTDFMLNYLGVDLWHWDYRMYTGNTDELARLRVLPGWQGKATATVFGVRNPCHGSLDALVPGGVGLPTLAVVASEYDSRSSPGGGFVAPASVFKDWDASAPYKTMVDGWDIADLTHANDVTTLDRSGYFHRIFTEVWSKLCVVQGTPLVPLDVPQLGDESGAFVALRNNPTTSGRATIRFGLPRADRVEVKLFDVSGRLVRTLADRRFATGEHEVTWDGLDDRGRAVARGVYFTRVRYRETSFDVSRKLTLLR